MRNFAKKNLFKCLQNVFIMFLFDKTFNKKFSWMIKNKYLILFKHFDQNK